MRTVFTAPTTTEAAVVRNLLVRHGIYGRLVNRSFGRFGVPHAEVWVPEVEEDRAMELVRELYSEPAEEEEAWRCRHCGESNPGSFELCWSCGPGEEE